MYLHQDDSEKCPKRKHAKQTLAKPKSSTFKASDEQTNTSREKC